MIYRNGYAFADYALAVKAATDVIRDYGITSCPCDLDKIIKLLSNEVKLIPYTLYAKRAGISLAETIHQMESEVGTCIYFVNRNQYLILYNDTKDYAWCRFTIAHELGHVFLEHLITAGVDMLRKSQMSEREYKEYEREADAFARNLLSPAPLAATVYSPRAVNKENYRKMMNAFYITHTAAKTRIDFIERDIKNSVADDLAFLAHLNIARYPFYQHV